LNLYSIPKENFEEKAELFSNEISTRFHESSAVFTKDGKTMYFTRNNYFDNQKKKDENNITQLQIYKAELINGKWTNITSLPINSDSFSTEHPALSNDENTLYFASDKPGGFGGFDLYKVNTKDFKNPENLGAKINTNRREQFPFISENDDLYFASNGHPGFGLLDVFVSEIKDGKFQKPDNIGLPVNSSYDDFAFFLMNDKDGYFSSNRPSGKGSDDIYKFQETKDLIIEDCYQLISGTSLHKITKEIIPNTKIELTAEGEVLETFTTGEDGKFNFKIECEKNYTITASKANYEGDSKDFRSNSVRKKENNIDLFLISITESEKIESEKKAQKAAELAEKLEAEKQADAERKAKIERAAKQNIMQKESTIVEKDNRIFIKTEPIYFDYDLWYIRKESRVILNKVVDILKKYPEMTIEIGTHTDIRGDVKYNQKLSLKRSNSVLDYFESQGVNRNRIIAKGYGESQPIIKCETEESCTEEQHEINRRCEFEILSFTE
ncbi:MAG: OmpA family protein, partial [Psychroflexus sp.]